MSFRGNAVKIRSNRHCRDRFLRQSECPKRSIYRLIRKPKKTFGQEEGSAGFNSVVSNVALTDLALLCPFASTVKGFFAFKKGKTMKRILSFALAVILILSCFVLTFAVSDVGYVTSAQTPTQSAKLKFSKKLGNGFTVSPTPPLLVSDTIIVASANKLYKLSAKDGIEIARTDLTSNVGYAITAPLYADGKIFVAQSDGIIQAFDYKTMKSLWIYKDSLGGQGLCPIIYDGGFVYTGFWNGEEEKASFVCVSVKDENPKSQTEKKKAKWQYKSKGGFYNVGCAVSGSWVVLGKDDGQKGYEGKNKILCLSNQNGKAVSSLDAVGDLRSSVVYDSQTKSFYLSSKAGYVYKFSLASKSGKLSSLSKYKASGSITATPAVYSGRIYVGCQDKTKGFFLVLDAAKMKLVYKAQMQGYPQATALVSTGYENKVYVYLTYNSKPGGITVFEDSKGQKSAKQAELFTPDDSMSQYCISPIVASSDGTLYYKNDSGNIMAVTKKSTSVIATLIDVFFAMLRKILGK